VLLLPWPGVLLTRAKCTKEPLSAFMLDKTRNEGNALAHGERSSQANLQAPTIKFDASTTPALTLVPLGSTVSSVVSARCSSILL
jgi:hypothetical protein